LFVLSLEAPFLCSCNLFVEDTRVLGKMSFPEHRRVEQQLEGGGGRAEEETEGQDGWTRVIIHVPLKRQKAKEVSNRQERPGLLTGGACPCASVSMPPPPLSPAADAEGRWKDGLSQRAGATLSCRGWQGLTGHPGWR
jgi:hypothetical protein